jgi:O-glycosyl hydrolase
MCSKNFSGEVMVEGICLAKITSPFMKVALYFGSLALLVACAAGNLPPISDPAKEETTLPTEIQAHGEILVDFTQELQTLEGFGASGAWWAQDVGGWEDEVRERIVKLLFDQEEGIGLSIYRYNIGGGDGESIPDAWRRAETFEVEPGVYDWSRDANAVWVLKAAQRAGVEHFVAFANSPPARMTVSGRTNGEENGLSNLAPEMYAEFANYLVDVVRHLQDGGDPDRMAQPHQRAPMELE